jgi:hypothetical protein
MNRSAVVPGFERVSIASGLNCPHCAKAFGADDFHRDGDDICLRCAGCEHDAVTATLAFDEEGE